MSTIYVFKFIWSEYLKPWVIIQRGHFFVMSEVGTSDTLKVNRRHSLLRKIRVLSSSYSYWTFLGTISSVDNHVKQSDYY